MNTPPDDYVSIPADEFQRLVHDLNRGGLPDYARRLQNIAEDDPAPRHTNRVTAPVSGVVVQAGNIVGGLHL